MQMGFGNIVFPGPLPDIFHKPEVEIEAFFQLFGNLFAVVRRQVFGGVVVGVKYFNGVTPRNRGAGAIAYAENRAEGPVAQFDRFAVLVQVKIIHFLTLAIHNIPEGFKTNFLGEKRDGLNNIRPGQGRFRVGLGSVGGRRFRTWLGMLFRIFL